MSCVNCIPGTQEPLCSNCVNNSSVKSIGDIGYAVGTAVYTDLDSALMADNMYGDDIEVVQWDGSRWVAYYD